MILSDRDLRARLAAGSLIMTPEVDLATQLQPASIDLRLGNELRATAPGVVKGVKVKAGQAVEKGQVLVEFEVS